MSENGPNFQYSNPIIFPNILSIFPILFKIPVISRNSICFFPQGSKNDRSISNKTCDKTVYLGRWFWADGENSKLTSFIHLYTVLSGIRFKRS
ncbi:hypothetical protein KUTeg_011035 [Tegillarca granosa]|uniref:Uncharacterized protein n=1 Tax=Tegillarca granosa TaxID=220873 RepID=A0ABQ9F5Z5_TEGGR|nr:hypothetical protein KUTeg_011035 [Tegillarca granosa]